MSLKDRLRITEKVYIAITGKEPAGPSFVDGRDHDDCLAYTDSGRTRMAPWSLKGGFLQALYVFAHEQSHHSHGDRNLGCYGENQTRADYDGWETRDQFKDSLLRQCCLRDEPLPTGDDVVVRKDRLRGILRGGLRRMLGEDFDGGDIDTLADWITEGDTNGGGFHGHLVEPRGQSRLIVATNHERSTRAQSQPTTPGRTTESRNRKPRRLSSFHLPDPDEV